LSSVSAGVTARSSTGRSMTAVDRLRVSRSLSRGGRWPALGEDAPRTPRSCWTRRWQAKRLLWYVAPTRVMAKDIMWADLKDAALPFLAYAPLETELLVRFVNGSRIHVLGAEDPTACAGAGLTVRA